MRGNWSFIDLTGRRFGRLVVTHRCPERRGVAIVWACKCDCGSAVDVIGASLRNGNTRSCGCLLRDWCSESKSTHGLSQSAEYRIWGLMKDRCLNEKARQYADYGGRGITICDAWIDDFEAFMRDMGPRPSVRHSVERMNNDGGYGPDNCRWALPLDQGNNKRNNVFLEIDGERLTVSQWARRVGLRPNVIQKRLKRGWPAVRAVMEPNMGN